MGVSAKAVIVGSGFAITHRWQIDTSDGPCDARVQLDRSWRFRQRTRRHDPATYRFSRVETSAVTG